VRPGTRSRASRAAVLALVVFEAIAASGAAPPAVLTSDDFFDQSVLHDIRLVMKQADWETLKAHYLEDPYYPADMQWRDQTVAIVGCARAAPAAAILTNPV